MKIKLIVVGKTADKVLKNGIDDYLKRLKHYIDFEWITLADIKNAKNMPKVVLKEKEGAAILHLISNTDELILLDESGKMYTSVGFSGLIDNRMQASRNLTFVIGGAFGFSQKVYDRANGKFSLSKMTFSHQMARLIFIEQLYRAMTIIKGEPYHNI